MKFFVAKVNLEAQKASGVQYLRPLQIAYESKKFMLPIRLGMANASGPQDHRRLRAHPARAGWSPPTTGRRRFPPT